MKHDTAAMLNRVIFFWRRCFGRYHEGERGSNDIMDKFCADDPNAEECKIFE